MSNWSRVFTHVYIVWTIKRMSRSALFNMNTLLNVIDVRSQTYTIKRKICRNISFIIIRIELARNFKIPSPMCEIILFFILRKAFLRVFTSLVSINFSYLTIMFVSSLFHYLLTALSNHKFTCHSFQDVTSEERPIVIIITLIRFWALTIMRLLTNTNLVI